jgi:hypothetical protein
MRSSTSPQMFSGEVRNTVERMVDRAFAGVLDRHDAEIGSARFDFVEDLIDHAQRQGAHRMAEVLVYRRLA